MHDLIAARITQLQAEHELARAAVCGTNEWRKLLAIEAALAEVQQLLASLQAREETGDDLSAD